MSNSSRLHLFHHKESRRRAREKAQWSDLTLAGVGDADILGHYDYRDCARALGTTVGRMKRILAGASEPTYAEGLKLSRLLSLSPWFLARLLEWRRRARETPAPASAASGARGEL